MNIPSGTNCTTFLNSDVLFAAAYKPNAGLRCLWGVSGISLITSQYAFDRAQRSLEAPDQRNREASLRRLADLTRPMTITSGSYTCALPVSVRLPLDDVPVMAGAIEAGTSWLLTNDLSSFGPYFGQTVSGVTINTPTAFLRMHNVTATVSFSGLISGQV